MGGDAGTAADQRLLPRALVDVHIPVDLAEIGGA